MDSNKKVAFYTLGCKLNFSETSAISRKFVDSGFSKVEFEEYADIYVINTCSVTENADKECKKIVKQALKNNSKAFICVIGCYAQLKPEEISDIEGVDLVLGATEKFNITEYVNDLTKKEFTEIHSCEIADANTFVDAYSLGDRTRAFLKVQDGCDYTCSYCTIPLARGISRSDKIENIIKNAYDIAKKDIKEIVLTGVNIGDYGKGEHGNKKHESTFFDLIKELDKVENIERIRISSIEPNLLKNEIINFVAQSKRFVPHFHIPLQSGSDKILKLMRRRYLKQLYIDRISKIKELIPNCCIGVDVIVGFPGETDDDFLETYNFLNELPVSYLHVFSYSERPNTDAILLDGKVSQDKKHKRSKMLRGLSAKKRRLFYSEQLNTTQTVLLEAENKNGFMYGFTPNYVKVKVPYNVNLINTLLTVTLSSFDEEGNVNGKILEKELIH